MAVEHKGLHVVITRAAYAVRAICGTMFKEPIFYIVIFSLFLFTLAINWGLPHTETWCPDSLAPFHSLLGLGQMFSFGYFNKYPLVHQVILAVVNLPVIVVAAVNSIDSYGLDILRFISLVRSEQYATALMLIDRMVSVFMAAGIVYTAYRSCLLLFDKKAAVFAALTVALNAALNLHAHIAKVDVPYLFWAMLGIYYLIRIVKYDRGRDHLLCAVMICLSFGTKDQAYAIFVLPLIAYLLFYQKRYWYGEKSWREYLGGKNFRRFTFFFLIGTLVVENVFLNPTGLAARFRHLTGIGTTASINYTLDISGIIGLLYMNGKIIADSVMGAPFLIISIAGIGLAIYRCRGNERQLWPGLIFLAAAASYYVFFIQVARQNAYRFTLPLSVFVSVYAGFYLGYLYERISGRLLRAGFYAILFACSISSLYLTCSINYNLLHDVRYKAEAWMADRIPAGSKIEYYSYLHYLPRFPKNSDAYRIKDEIAAVEKRRPDYIILSSSYDYRFIGNPYLKLPKGFKIPEFMLRLQKEYGSFYADLFGNRTPYRMAAMFSHDPLFFQEMRVFRIVPHRIVIFKRTGANERSTGRVKRYDPSILIRE